MTTYWQCDLCGESIEPDDRMVAVDAHGRGVDRSGGSVFINEYVGHYHGEPQDGERSCYGRIVDAVYLVHDAGPSLESIPTASAQRIGQLRSTHRRPGEPPKASDDLSAIGLSYRTQIGLRRAGIRSL